MAEAQPSFSEEKKQAFGELRKIEEHFLQAFLPPVAQQIQP